MHFQHIFSAAGDDLLELLQGLFRFDPCTRFTATQVINLPYKLLLVYSDIFFLLAKLPYFVVKKKNLHLPCLLHFLGHFLGNELVSDVIGELIIFRFVF